MTSKECANCCCRFEGGLIIREIVIESPNGSNEKSKWTNVPLKQVLTTVFKLKLLQNLPNFHPDSAITIKNEKGQKDDIFMCVKCAQVLTHLYKNHLEFMQLQKVKSYMANKIGQLDTILEEMQQTWTQMVNDDDDDDQHELSSSSLHSKVEDTQNCSIPTDQRQSTQSSSPRSKDKESYHSILTTQELTKVELNRNETNKIDLKFEADDDYVNFEEEDMYPETDPLNSNDYLEPMPLEEDASPETLDCVICEMKCPDIASLSTHLYQHYISSGSKRCPYPTCKKVLTSAYVGDHLNIHVGHKPYTCPSQDCLRTFAMVVTLRLHCQHKHGQETFSSSQLYKFQRARGRPKKEQRVRCHMCLNYFSNASDMAAHMFYKHVPPGTKTCPISSCGKYVWPMKAMKLHFEQHNQRHICVVKRCHENFAGLKTLERHYLKRHACFEIESQNEKSQEVNSSGRRLRSPNQIKKNQRDDFVYLDLEDDEMNPIIKKEDDLTPTSSSFV